MKNVFRFNELSLVAQSKAVDEYIRGWEETHEKDDIVTTDAYEILRKQNDARYSNEGKCLHNEGDLYE